MIERLGQTVVGKLLGVLQWLKQLFGRGSRDSPKPPIVENTGVSLDVNRLFDQNSDTAYKFGWTEAENAHLQSENADLRKAHDAAIAELKQRSRTDENHDRFNHALEELEKGRPETAEALFKKILEESRTRGHPAWREAARAACHLGAIAFAYDIQKALRAYEEATELDPGNTDAWNGLGHLRHRTGKRDQAKFAYEKMFNLGKSRKDDAITADALVNLGNISLTGDNLDEARKMFRRALALYDKLGHKEGIATVCARLGIVFGSQGTWDKAETMLCRALALYDELGHKKGQANAYAILGIVFGIQDNLDEAETMLRQALALYDELGHKEGQANAYTILGIVFWNQGNSDEAETMLRQALALYDELGHKKRLAHVYVCLGNVVQYQGHLAEACRLWHLAHKRFAEIDAQNELKRLEQNMRKAGCHP